MRKLYLFSVFMITSCIVCIVLFSRIGLHPLTFTQLSMNKEATMEKFKDDWDDTNIIHGKNPMIEFSLGDMVGTITIPKIELYELPIYNGSTEMNTNWQVTTPGHLGNYAMFGELGVSSVGSHNYQFFKNLPSLEAGDKILIETSIDRYVYVVESHSVYHHATDNWNLKATKHSSDSALNLMTCYPIEAVETDDMYIVYTSLQKGTILDQ